MIRRAINGKRAVGRRRHHHLRGGGRHHAMRIGGGERHRIRAGEPGVGDIAKAAIGAQADRAMGRRSIGAGGQPRTIGHRKAAGDGVVGYPRHIGSAAGQNIRYGDKSRHRGGLTACAIAGYKGQGIGAHKSLGRRISIGAVGTHADRAMSGRAAGTGGQSSRIVGGKGAGVAGRQRSRRIAGGGTQRIGHHDLAGGGADHPMAVGGTEGDRIGAHKPTFRHIREGAVAAHADGAMARRGTGIGDRQPGTIGDAIGFGNGVLRQDRIHRRRHHRTHRNIADLESALIGSGHQHGALERRVGVHGDVITGTRSIGDAGEIGHAMGLRIQQIAGGNRTHHRAGAVGAAIQHDLIAGRG